MFDEGRSRYVVTSHPVNEGSSGVATEAARQRFRTFHPFVHERLARPTHHF